LLLADLPVFGASVPKLHISLHIAASNPAEPFFLGKANKMVIKSNWKAKAPHDGPEEKQQGATW